MVSPSPSLPTMLSTHPLLLVPSFEDLNTLALAAADLPARQLSTILLSFDLFTYQFIPNRWHSTFHAHNSLPTTISPTAAIGTLYPDRQSRPVQCRQSHHACQAAQHLYGYVYASLSILLCVECWVT